MGRESGAHARRGDAAAAERDHVLRAGAGEQLAHQLLLLHSEGGLAVQLELACQRMTETLSEQLVAVERRGAKRLGELGGDGRLAGAHEADQDERHPIRSS